MRHENMEPRLWATSTYSAAVGYGCFWAATKAPGTADMRRKAVIHCFAYGSLLRVTERTFLVRFGGSEADLHRNQRV